MNLTLVTGASGFLGRELTAELVRRGVHVRAPLRAADRGELLPPGVEAPVVGDLTAIGDFGPLLEGVDAVMHLAARAHVIDDAGTRNAALYQLNNEELTRRLAEAAQRAGVRRFVFVSSIKAFGEADRGRPFVAGDPPLPEDVYGQSKLAAERALRAACVPGGMEPVIVRPPLVYGPGVRANFLRMMQIVDSGLPLPLASVANRRSMVSTFNLVDFLCRCGDAPAAAHQTLLVSDGEDLSTPELVRRLARTLGRPARLFRAPVPLLRAFARLVGYGGEMARLTDSLSLNIEASRAGLQWAPPESVDAGLARTVQAFRRARGASTKRGTK